MVTLTRVPLATFPAMPEIDERRLELIDGEVYEKPMHTWGLGSLAVELGALLNEVGYAADEPRAIMPASGNLDAASVLPDVAFYRSEPPADSGWMTRPPDVVIEILSPSQERRSLRATIDSYLVFGVGSVWVVDPRAQEIDVYEGTSRRTLSGPAQLSSSHAPGFAITVAGLFERLRRKRG